MVLAGEVRLSANKRAPLRLAARRDELVCFRYSLAPRALASATALVFLSE